MKIQINYFFYDYIFIACISMFAFLKITNSFLFIQKSKNNDIIRYSRKIKTNGYDERYSKIQNISSIAEYKSQYYKTITLFHLLNMLRDCSITNESKLSFIQENVYINYLYSKNNVKCADVYSGGLLDDWNFDI